MMLAHHHLTSPKHMKGGVHHQKNGGGEGACESVNNQLDVPCYWVNIWSRLNAMRSCLQLCDIDLEAEDGTSLRAHSAVLAASSEVFHGHFTLKNSTTLADIGDSKVLVRGISGQALKVTLDFVYGVTPQEPAELLMLLEGGRAMGITGALIFCKRKNVTLPDENPGYNNSALHSSHVETSNVAHPSISEDSANTNPISSDDPHGNFILDLSFNDLDVTTKCPHLRKLAAEDGTVHLADSPMVMDEAVQHSSTNTSSPVGEESTCSGNDSEKDYQQPENQLVSFDDDNTIARDVQDMLPGSKSKSPGDMIQIDDALDTEGIIAQEDAVGDLDINVGDLACPFSKSVTSHSAAAGDHDIMAEHHGSGGFHGNDSDSSLQCPFLKSLEEIPPDTLMDPEEGIDKSTGKKPGSSTSVKIIESLNLLSGDNTNTESNCEEKQYPNFSSKMMDSIYEDTIATAVTPNAGQEGCSAHKISSYKSHPVRPVLDKNIENLYCADNILRPAATHTVSLSRPQEYQVTQGTSFNSAVRYSQDLHEQGVPAPSTNQHLSPNPLVPCNEMPASSSNECGVFDNPSLVKQRTPQTYPSYSPDYRSVSSENHNDSYYSEAMNLAGAGPQYPVMYHQDGSTVPSIVETIYSDSSSNIAGMTGCCDGPKIKYDAINCDSQPVLSPMPPAIPRCSRSMTSPEARCHNRVVSPDGRMVSPDGRMIRMDGRMVSPDGRMVSPDSRMVSPDGRMVSPDGRMVSPDGRMIRMDGSMVNPDGRMVSPDGRMVRMDGSMMSPQSRISSNSSLMSPGGQLENPETFVQSNLNPGVIDNSGIKAQLKLSRHQEYSCLLENCSYSNKCLDYMQSHMFRKHGMGQPDIPCQKCSKFFFSASQVKSHFKRAHKPEVQEVDCEMPCDDCNEVFPNGQKLLTHRLKMHFKGRLFMCEACDFRSPRKKDVQAHMVSQHDKIPPGVQVYNCMQCDYKCTDKNRAEEHHAMHSGQPKFLCKICSKPYTTRRGMRTHMQYHSAERPHQCDVCNAAFKVRSKMRDHIRLVHTHVGVKPYQCSYCGHRTALRGNCNQHCRKHHPELPVSVIDLQLGERQNKRTYDYAGLHGDGIEECKDVRKHLRCASP